MNEQQRAAMEQALEALKQFSDISDFTPASAVHAITALTAALEQPRGEATLAPVPEAHKQEPVAIDVIYAAWHGAGVDIAGGNWSRFAGMLPTLYIRPQAQEPVTKECDTCRHCQKSETGLHSFNADFCRQCCHYLDSKYEAAHQIGVKK